MAEEMTALVTLEAGTRFAGVSGSGHRLTLTGNEHAGEYSDGFHPMELLLLGLAGCTAMDVMGILRKERQDVTGYEVRVHGIRAEDQPMAFPAFTVEHIVSGHRVDPAAVAHAVESSDMRYRGAGDMLGRMATVVHTYRIQEAEVVADDARAADVLVVSFHGEPEAESS